MFIWKSKTYTIAFLLGTLNLSALALEAPGGSGGGEGNSASFDFVMRNSLRAITEACKSPLNTEEQGLCANLPYLLGKAALTAVVTREQITGSDNAEKDAGNDGAGTIYVSRPRWEALAKSKSYLDKQKQVQLSIHEPAVLAGLEKNDHYQISNQYVAMLERHRTNVSEITGLKVDFENLRLVEKIFNGKVEVCSGQFNGSPTQNCWGAALADAETNASKEGFSGCVEYEDRRNCQEYYNQVTFLIFQSAASPTGQFQCATQVRCRKEVSLRAGATNPVPAQKEENPSFTSNHQSATP